MTAPFEPAPGERVPALVEQFKGGLAAPICLTWEWTYACNLVDHRPHLEYVDVQISLDGASWQVNDAVRGHGSCALPGLDRGGLPRPEKDHSHRGRAVPLGMPSVHVPAKLCDSSPLAVTP